MTEDEKRDLVLDLSTIISRRLFDAGVSGNTERAEMMVRIISDMWLERHEINEAYERLGI